ncbi:MAG: amidohydrolase family protein, partial [Bradymonadaceae bacterium]
MTDLLIRDVVCFTPIQRIEGDVLIEDGRVTEIGRVTGSSDNVVHGRKRWLWPGAIDGHVHFRDPGPTHKEDWTTGSTAAVAGGVTTVLEMPNTSPTTTTVKRLEEKRALASAKSLCNFGLFFGASTTNLDEVRRENKATGVCGRSDFHRSPRRTDSFRVHDESRCTWFACR